MSIDAERLVAAIDDYKAADGVHANRLSYVLERDDARRVAEAAKGVTADDAQRFYEVRDNEFQEGELPEAGTIGALADFLARRAGTSAGVTVTDDLVRVAQDALARYHFNIAFYAVKSALEAALAAAPSQRRKRRHGQPAANTPTVAHATELACISAVFIRVLTSRRRSRPSQRRNRQHPPPPATPAHRRAAAWSTATAARERLRRRRQIHRSPSWRRSQRRRAERRRGIRYLG